ncbi:nuclear transport factor 2 family protein [uncultured Shewanella sp.]|uniref:nuclear transport factor 2 family protein n=1 Tax=uncultured Shewanella sp. TaxID=173975 RepID=UPI00262D0C97|nr:nuclear transport factor 2 family protein [uncultured Shewanella sp.]
MKLSLISILILLLFTNLSAKASNGTMPAEQAMAVDYMDALTHQKFKKLTHYYNRDSIFFDKTANRKYIGRDNILYFLKRVQQGVLEYKFTIDHMFNSGSLVVLIGNYYYKGPGDLFGKPGKIIDLAIPSVTMLTLDMNKRRVKEHQDLLDYQTMSDQLAIQ